MRQYFCSGFGSGATEDLLHGPETRVIESLGERHNIRSGNVFVLLRPCTAGQLVRLNLGKDGKVQESDLIGQLLGGDTQRTADDCVHFG